MYILMYYISKCICIIITQMVHFIGQHPNNDTFCEGSNAVLKCVIFDNSTNNAADTTGWFSGNPPTAVSSSNIMINNTRDGDMVTSALIIKNISLNYNGNGYFCSAVFGIGTNVGVTSVAGNYEHLILTLLLLYAHFSVFV